MSSHLVCLLCYVQCLKEHSLIAAGEGGLDNGGATAVHHNQGVVVYAIVEKQCSALKLLTLT